MSESKIDLLKKTEHFILHDELLKKYQYLFLSNINDFVNGLQLRYNGQNNHINMLYLKIVMSYNFIADLLLKGILIKKNNKSHSPVDYAFIYDTSSHYQILENIYNHFSENSSTLLISPITGKNRLIESIFIRRDMYVDSYISWKGIIKSIKLFVSLIKDFNNIFFKLFNFFSNSFYPDFRNYKDLFIKVSFSIRYSFAVRNFLEEFKPKFIFQASDACFRSSLIVFYSKNPKILVQHGLVANPIQYYTKSNYFFYWSKYELQKLYKNKNTTYNLIGYPKREELFNNIKYNKESKNALFILTGTKDKEYYDKVFYVKEELEHNDITVFIKPHPLYCEKKLMEVSHLYDDNNNYRIVISFNSSLGIELAIRGYPVLFVSCSSEKNIIPELHYDQIENVLTNNLLLTDYLAECSSKLEEIFPIKFQESIKVIEEIINNIR
ncbi:MAG: hypothetical protein HF314_11680 [Ignavibacteria bacterium]|jgi:hypothetical protein|nr:hypothetical protein [Ignavibacteria bacterium]MCU7503730.1 hypothetical protein [Ignavibacteria bacterium]MCU7517624.1 hypothetical protein [Ignavibacteria bacterium]